VKKPEVVGKLYHIMLYRIRLAWAGFELTTLVVIGSDCTGSCKFNSHMITTTTVRPIVKFYILFQTVRGNMLKRSAMQSFKNRTFNKQLLQINIWWLIDWLTKILAVFQLYRGKNRCYTLISITTAPLDIN
jgi:hypothetical protein